MKTKFAAILLLIGLSSPTVMAEPSSDTATAVARERAIAQQIKLSQVEAQRLVARCQAAQGRLSVVVARLDVSGQRRNITYQKTIDLLITLADGMKRSGLDATVVSENISNMQQTLLRFNTSFGNYRALLQEAIDLDCVATPEGFRATLEEARAARRKVVTESQNFHDLALVEARDRLYEQLQNEGAAK